MRDEIDSIVAGLDDNLIDTVVDAITPIILAGVQSGEDSYSWIRRIAVRARLIEGEGK